MTEGAGASLAAQTLTVTSGGGVNPAPSSISLGGPNQIGVIRAELTGAITLSNAAALRVDVLSSPGTIDVSTTAGDLTVARTSATFDGSGDAVAGHTVRLAAAGDLTFAAGNFPNSVVRANTTLTLAAGGAITQSSGALIANTLTGSAGQAALTQPGNQISGLGAFAATGDFSLADSLPLTVTGPVAVGTGRTLSLVSDSIQVSTGGGLSAPGGVVALAPLTPGQAFSLAGFVPSGAITASTLRVGNSTTGNITISGVFTLDTVGTLDLRSAGSITEVAGAILQVGALTGQADSASLTSTGNGIGTLGAFTTNTGFALTEGQGQSLTVTGPVTDPVSIALNVPTGSLTLNGDLTTASLDLRAGGAITQTGGAVGASLLTGSANSVSLTGTGNTVAALGPFSATAGLLLTDAQGLAVQGAVSATTLTLNVAGNLALQAPVSATTATLIATGAITGSQLNVGTLTGQAASVSVSGAVTTLADFTTASGFALADQRSLAVTGTVADGATIQLVAAGDLTTSGVISAPNVSLAANGSSEVGGGTLTQTGGSVGASTQLTLRAASDIRQTGGTISAGTLTGAATGVAALASSGNAIGTLGAFSSGRGFTLADGQALSVTGPVADLTSIGLTVAGALTLNGTLNAPTVTLAAAGAITQPGGGITATTVTGSGASAALASSGNAVTNLGNFTTTGNFTLADGRPLTVTGTVSVGGGQTLSLASDSIQLGAASQLLAPGGVVALAPFTPGTAFALGSFVPTGGAIVADTLRVGSATTGSIGISGVFNLSNVHTLDLRSAGDITEGRNNGGSLQVASLTGSAGSATLDGQNAIGTLAGFTTGTSFALTNTQNLAVTGPVQAGTTASLTVAGNLALAADITAPTLTLGTTGAITQTGGLIRATTLASFTASSASLTGNNQIGTLGGFSVGTAFTLTDTTGLIVAGPGQAPVLTLNAGGSVQLAGDITSATSLTVNAAGSVVQTGGTLNVGTLAGTAVGLAQFGGTGTANVGTLGSMVLTGSTLSLIDSVKLTVAGPLVAGTVTLSAPGAMTLAGGRISSDDATLSVIAAERSGEPRAERDHDGRLQLRRDGDATAGATGQRRLADVAEPGRAGRERRARPRDGRRRGRTQCRGLAGERFRRQRVFERVRCGPGRVQGGNGCQNLAEPRRGRTS